MPTLTVDGVGAFEVPAGKRLVLALADDAGVDQLYACGGNAKCTTCRVEFLAGEPTGMTEAEEALLSAKRVSGVRLSCQIACDHDMTVTPLQTEGSTGLEAGKAPAEVIEPEPQWVSAG